MNTPDVWSNKLKDARERRNAADYDPYPKSEEAWRHTAESLLPDARALIQEVSNVPQGKRSPIPMTASEARSIVAEAFASQGIPVEELLTREYPQETVFVVHVRDAHLPDRCETRKHARHSASRTWVHRVCNSQVSSGFRSKAGSAS